MNIEQNELLSRYVTHVNDGSHINAEHKKDATRPILRIIREYIAADNTKAIKCNAKPVSFRLQRMIELL